MRDGESTVEDWKELATRFAGAPSVSFTEFSNAACILPRKVDVAEFNFDKLKSLNCPVARIDAIHTGGNEACKANSDVANTGQMKGNHVTVCHEISVKFQ